MQNIKQLQTPFVWNFVNNADIVASFQHYWQKTNSKGQIKAAISTNPQLSLNFSGAALNSMLHNKLIISSQLAMQANVKLQVKTDIADEVFYYSKTIKLNSKRQIINLAQIWQGINANTNEKTTATWGGSKHKVSSLVLQFSKLESDLIIDSINIPYASQNLSQQTYTVNCNAELINKSRPNTKNINILKVTENCYLPSNYLWLKQYLQNKYPQSILQIDATKLWLPISLHKVNKSYTSIINLNMILYALIIFMLFVAFYYRNKFQSKTYVTAESWYKWLTKQLLFKGVDKVVAPHHLLLNYLFVLVPTLIILLIMMYLKFPNSSEFNLLPKYFLWAILQQFILGYVFALRIFYNRTQNRLISSILAALVFSIFHLPSVTLMLGTFIAGCFWAYAWLTFRRFLPLAISHSTLALMFYYLVPDKVLYTAKVLQWFWE